LIDLRDDGISGAVAEQRCSEAGITLNRNAIPYDPEPPTVTSGIRVGTPSVTTQGMGPEEMKEVASMVAQVIRSPDTVGEIRRRVTALTQAYQVYPREL
jgi:glycine hydroxymethyltransferase